MATNSRKQIAKKVVEAPWKKYMKLSLEELERKYDAIMPPEDPESWCSSSIKDALFSYDGVLQHCCGIVEIGEFSGWDTKDPKEAIPYTLAYGMREVMNSEKVNTLLATTISSQRTEAGWLKNMGFKVVGTTVNPKTSNTITIWLYTEK